VPALSGQESIAMSARSPHFRLVPSACRRPQPSLTPIGEAFKLSLTTIGEPLNGSLTPEVSGLKGSRKVRFQAREAFVCACTFPLMKGSFCELSDAGQSPPSW
jgi:hypothetical protein